MLDDPLVQNAILQRVDDSEWFFQGEALFPEESGREGTLITLIGDQSPVNVRWLYTDVESSPDELKGLPITLLISESDGTSRTWASLFIEALRVVDEVEGTPVIEDPGIIWTIEEVAPSAALDRFNTLAAERPTLWLQRIPEPPPTDDPETETDTSSPEIIRLEHVPEAPTTEDDVTIFVEARDPESGIASIEISLFGNTVETCNSTTCVAELGQLDEGTYEYQVVVTNGAGLAEEPFSRQFDVVSDTGCEIAPGDQVVVVDPNGEGINVRDSPTTSADVVTVVLDGTEFEIEDGPWAGDGFTWWHVSGVNGTGYIIEDFLDGCPSEVDDNQVD
jgi:hypothetical protein